MTNTTKQLTTSLTVNKHNKIIFIEDESWIKEAELGKAEDTLSPEKVLNNYLSNYIRDDNTVMFVETLLSLARIKNQTVVRPYRCDSPSHKRFMEIELIPQPNKSVIMNHYLLKEVPFEFDIEIIDTTSQGPVSTQDTYLRCSMCNALSKPNPRKWTDPADLNLTKTTTFNVIHTICPKCAEKLKHNVSSINNSSKSNQKLPLPH